MPKFRYVAVDAQGKSHNDILEALNKAMVADHAHRQGWMLVDVANIAWYERARDLLRGEILSNQGLQKSAVAQFTRQLSVMLAAGQDIDHAFQYLVEVNDKRSVKAVITSLRNHVRGGKSLTASLGEHPKVFSRLYISLVRAGEAGGQLATTLGQIADLLERESKLASSLKSAMIYPALLVAAAIATVVLLLTYVLPQFTPIFSQAGAKLPGPTQFLMTLGDVVRNDGLWMLTAVLVAFAIFYRLLKQAAFRSAFDRYVVKIPLFGNLIRRSQAARLTRTLGTLLTNGLGLVPSLAIGREVLGNRQAIKIVSTAATQVKSGSRLAAALRTGKFFPLETIHLLQLGEETGKLGEMSLRAAEVHDEQVKQSIQTIMTLLVPIITIVMGAVVAGIVGSLLVAMLSLNDLAL